MIHSVARTASKNRHFENFRSRSAPVQFLRVPVHFSRAVREPWCLVCCSQFFRRFHLTVRPEEARRGYVGHRTGTVRAPNGTRISFSVNSEWMRGWQKTHSSVHRTAPSRAPWGPWPGTGSHVSKTNIQLNPHWMSPLNTNWQFGVHGKWNKGYLLKPICNWSPLKPTIQLVFNW